MRKLLWTLLLLCPTLSVAQTAVTGASFGFQCGQQAPNCTNAVYPSAAGSVGTLRIWDMSIAWGEIDKSTGYNWTLVDQWLDNIYANQVTPNTQLVEVWYTFGMTPCYLTAGTNCGTRGSPDPPLDLTSSGSPSFNAFVTAFVGRCNANLRCVKDLIKYYGTWNEPNAAQFGTFSQLQLYQMIKPAWAIIQANVTGAQLGTPEISAASGFQNWIQTYLGVEVANGIISTRYAFHRYLAGNTPESMLTNEAQQICPNSGAAFGCVQVAGWTTLPVVDTELGFASATYVCDTTVYSTLNCAGQVVRQQILLQSNSIQGLFWYKWMLIVGTVPLNLQYYNQLVALTKGGSYPSPCTSSGNPAIYTCPFTESNGTTALWVWTPSESSATYVPSASYNQYKTLSGGVVHISAAQPTTVSVAPVLFEASTTPPVHGLSLRDIAYGFNLW